MSSPTSDSPKDLVELTSVFRGGENEEGKVAKVYESELCMLALPPDEQQLLSRVSQYLFYRGIVPVVVRSPSEALIHSRHSRFAIIILPDNDPALIRKVRSADGMNHGTPVIVISSADILADSTLHMLGTNEIQEAIHRTTNSEKLEADLIAAINHVIGQMCHIGKDRGCIKTRPLATSLVCKGQVTDHTTVKWTISSSQGDPGMPLLPLPVQTTWSTIPQYTSSQMPSTSVHPSAGIPQPQCAANYFPAVAIGTSPTQVLRGQPLGTVYGLQMPGHLPSCRSQQLQDGVIDPCATNFRSSEPAIEAMSQMSSPVLKISPPLCKNTQENTESVLPGIETLLNAIQVVEGEAGAANQVEDATFTKFTALNSSESEDKRENKLPRSRRTRLSSAAERQKRARAAISDTDLEALNDTKSPIAASLATKKPYFLELDSYREALADDPNANAVDRHNSKERHRRIRITKAAEFFKSVIPCMDPNMDKATAFHWTVHYMVFLRNALLDQDPPIIPKLHQTFVEEWGDVFNFSSKRSNQTE